MRPNDEMGGEAPCPRCGETAEWRAVGENGATVEIECPDCGLISMPREDFEEATVDFAEPERRD